MTEKTPASGWRENGEPDPHGTRYECPREELAMGGLTDDQLANGAYMNYDRPLDIHAIMTKQEGYASPIAWMTAVKDRIRWLSRQLFASQQRNNEQAVEYNAMVDTYLRKEGEQAQAYKELSDKYHAIGWVPGRYGYQTLFDAIGAATYAHGGTAIEISVKDFEEAMAKALPTPSPAEEALAELYGFIKHHDLMDKNSQGMLKAKAALNDKA